MKNRQRDSIYENVNTNDISDKLHIKSAVVYQQHLRLIRNYDKENKKDTLQEQTK